MPNCPFDFGTFYVAGEISSQLALISEISAILQKRGLTPKFDWTQVAVSKPYRDFPENRGTADCMIEAATNCQYFVFVAMGDPHGGKMEFGAARLGVARNANKKILVVTDKNCRDSIFYADEQEQIICVTTLDEFRLWVEQNIPQRHHNE